MLQSAHVPVTSYLLRLTSSGRFAIRDRVSIFSAINDADISYPSNHFSVNAVDNAFSTLLSNLSQWHSVVVVHLVPSHGTQLWLFIWFHLMALSCGCSSGSISSSLPSP
ncbi:hypothetical protein J6590_097613 [Homalodisca vitripennis]|nr:hypothetical protein J6590_097613 [Homalodisca vitripennis]